MRSLGGELSNLRENIKFNTMRIIITKSHLTTFLVMWSKELKLICASFIVSFVHSMFAFCRARASSIVAPLVAREITTVRNNLELGDYPDPEGIKVGNVHFR